MNIIAKEIQEIDGIYCVKADVRCVNTYDLTRLVVISGVIILWFWLVIRINDSLWFGILWRYWDYLLDVVRRYFKIVSVLINVSSILQQQRLSIYNPAPLWRISWHHPSFMTDDLCQKTGAWKKVQINGKGERGRINF